MGDLEREISSAFVNQRIKALVNIKFTASWLDQLGHELFKPFNISEQQYNILRILRGAGKEITITEVKSRMVQKSPNATRLMDKLCEKKLIERRRCDNDRRVVFVKITKKGLGLLEKINISKLEQLMNRLSESEAKTLNQLLDKIR